MKTNYLLLPSLLVALIALPSLSKAETLKVAIIDGRPDSPALIKAGVPLCQSFMKESENDLRKGFKEHGSNIAMTVTKGLRNKDICLSWYSPDRVAQSIRQAVKDGNKFINISLGGVSHDKHILDTERYALLYAMVRGVKVVIAAGNESLTLTEELCKVDYYIGCHGVNANGLRKYLSKNLFYVGHNKYIINNKNKKTVSNTFKGMYTIEEACSDEYTMLCGTSQSAAVFTNKLLLAEFK